MLLDVMDIMCWPKVVLRWPQPHPNPPNVWKILLKILAAQNTRGKNFGGVFLDVFHLAESESEVGLPSNFLIHEISKLSCLFVHDCSTYIIGQAQER